jgi:hypothetical protein
MTVLTLAFGGLVLSILMTPTNILHPQIQQQAIAQTMNNNTVRVDAGGGNARRKSPRYDK